MATSDPASLPVVCDAGPLIHLQELSCLDLLLDYQAVLVPISVWREVDRHSPGALSRPQKVFRRVQITPEENTEVAALARFFVLHQGESDALQVAWCNPGALLFTDDTAARMAAHSLGIQVHGTIGILIRSIRRNLRTQQQVITVLESIPEKSSLHIKPALLADVIRQLQSA